MPAQPAPSGGKPAPADTAKRILPANPKAAAIVALGFTLVLYLVELVDVLVPGDFTHGGIVARSLSGLDGVIWAPLLHAGWGHLLGNTIPVLVFAFLAMAAGIGRFAVITAMIWVIGGLGVWLIGPNAPAVTVGASGLAFGWLAFLLVRGVFNRALGQIAVALVLLVLWGGMLWGVLPGNPGISWQGHLFGALAGVLAAWVVTKTGKSREAKPAGNLGV
ncbi:rhomboid family intramembrane serine protease [Amycolatopsis minnesotensis]|uniref:Rhomboid family intramembrane serine protease n=1 Tax=Amycolatopsis minnesotensis TaxID=337894 RepID=A0ABN2RQ83_9PSEU